MLKNSYTTRELADLLNISERSIQRRALRENWSSRKRQGRGGGNEYICATLPQSVQLAIRVAEERKILASYDGIVAPKTIERAALTSSITKTVIDDKRRYKALAMSDLIALFLDWQRKHGFTTKQKQAFVDAYLAGTWPELLKEIGTKGVSWKSLERKKLLLKETDSILSLADMRGIAHKNRSVLTEKHRLIILGQVLNPNAPNVGECSHRIQARCKDEGLYVPSDATIRRFVHRYIEECYDEWILWREGQKAWNDKCAISLFRNWNLVEVGDIVIADGHTLNFETIDPATGKGKRMTLLLFYDGASNHPLGWDIMATENTACISAAFRRTCMLLGKYPRVVYLDNGKAFRAKFFKGTNDFRQAGFLGLYRELGCEVIHAWPYHGQSKPIERFFGTFHEMEVFVPSYTGNCIDRKPPRMKRGEVMHNKLYEKLGGRPLTLEETHRAIATWFCEYSQRQQFRTHLEGRSPSEVFEAGRGPGVDIERLQVMMMQKEIKTITKDGIKHMGKYFWDSVLEKRRHPVLIRYDEQFAPHNVLVYTLDGKPLCEARERGHYGIAYGLHPAARVLGTAEQQQALEEAIELKRGQEKQASAGFRGMLDVVLTETQMVQAKIIQPSLPKGTKKALPAPRQETKMTAQEIQAVEEAKAQACADFDTNSSEKLKYTPAMFMRFKDELAKYDYLFHALHREHAELIEQDLIWMEAFEKTDVFQRTYRRLYDQYLEHYAFREKQKQAM